VKIKKKKKMKRLSPVLIKSTKKALGETTQPQGQQQIRGFAAYRGFVRESSIKALENSKNADERAQGAALRSMKNESGGPNNPHAQSVRTTPGTAKVTIKEYIQIILYPGQKAGRLRRVLLLNMKTLTQQIPMIFNLRKKWRRIARKKKNI
jgi:hypothetical protein